MTLSTKTRIPAPSLTLGLLGLMLLSFACGPARGDGADVVSAGDSTDRAMASQAPGKPDEPDAPAPEGLAKATFAGGCFWCMEGPFDAVDGVISTTSGYTGGHKDDPTYKEVSSGTTGHAESMQVVYDPQKVSYEKLLYVYWRNVDPLDDGGQFCDRGNQYRTSIFYHSEEQKRLAEASKAEVEAKLGKKVVTPIVPATTFYPAEDYHQDYYEKNPLRYKFYRSGCGRDHRLEELWGDEAGGGHH